MISAAFTAAIYIPLYNALIWLVSVMPGGDVGLAIILLTVCVKILLLPITKKATETQLLLKHIAPKLDKIKEDHKDDQQEQVKRMLALYKEHRVNPLAGIITILVQLPIIIGLYRVFLRGGLPTIDPTHLYSFVHTPTTINMHFLGFFDLGGKSIILAALAGIIQFVIAQVTFEAPVMNTAPGQSLKDDIMRSLHLQTKYILPIFVGVFAYFLSAAVALHWAAGNIFSLIQDLIVRKRFARTIENASR